MEDGLETNLEPIPQNGYLELVENSLTILPAKSLYILRLE